jgi:hypothetical protein
MSAFTPLHDIKPTLNTIGWPCPRPMVPLILASHGGGANVSIQDSAATQEGTSIPVSPAGRDVPRSSGAARSPLANVATGSG